MITRDCIDRVLEASDIVKVISWHIEVKQKGPGYEACCPFHDEKTPSFKVSVPKQAYHCFGCGKSGNVVSFVMQYKKYSFVETIKYLAGEFNVPVEYEKTNWTPEQEDLAKRADTVLNVALEKYHSILLDDTTDSKSVRKYLLDRGITIDDIKEWKLGLAPLNWQLLTDKFRNENLFDIANQIGIIATGDNNHSYDSYRCRVIVPIQNNTGFLKGFGGRRVAEAIDVDTYNKSLSPEGKSKIPKWINPKESFHYKKGNILFGFNVARTAIHNIGYAILVEGYFDVISMHKKGFINTIGSCGTALTIEQVKIIRKHTNTLVMMYDGDGAGVEAMYRGLDLCVAEGLKVLVFRLEKDQDPDTWAQQFNKKKPAPTSDDFLKLCHDGLLWYSLEQFEGELDPHQKDRAQDNIAQRIALFPSENIRNDYTELIAKSLNIKKKKPFLEKIKSWIEKHNDKKEAELRKRQAQDGVPENFTLPGELLGKGLKWSEVADDIKKYQLFIYDNRIWSRRGDESKYYFKDISNFGIKIIQHIEQENGKPRRLAQISNVFGRKRTFDDLASNYTNIYSFKAMVEGWGNFNIDRAVDSDYIRLKEKLMDQMGDGRMIEVLGWQKEGMFVYNNAIIYPDKKILYPDQDGCFEHNKESYYIPSSNRIFEKSNDRFQVERKFVLRQAQVTFSEYCQKVIEVHRHHAMNPLLFTVATFFSDLIFERLGYFPLMFLYGAPSSGKDNLIECCQAFWGRPQDPIELTGTANTIKGKIRTFAQLCNSMVHMSEYKSGNEDIDLWVASIFNRKGYVKGNIESSVGTTKTSILQSLIFTGNFYPTLDALITRLVAEEMNKNDFDKDEMDRYDALQELIRENGISSLAIDIISLRGKFEKEFRHMHKEVSADIKSDLQSLNLVSRMIGSAAVLGATLRLTEGTLDFGFDYEQWKQHMFSSMQKQANKRVTGSIVSQFWNCILEAMREGKSLIYEEDWNVEGSYLFMQWTVTHNAYMRKHFEIFKTAGEPRNSMQDKLKNHESWSNSKDSHRYGKSKNSAYVFNIKKTGIDGEILAVMDKIERHRNGENRQNESAPDAEKRNLGEVIGEPGL